MRITESNTTLASQWAHLRPEEPSAPTRDAAAKPAAQTAAVAAGRLDIDRDGWLDEDDVPYDQLERLARKAEDNAELGGIHLAAAAATPLASEVLAAADPTPAAQAGPDPEPHGAAPHLDLLA